MSFVETLRASSPRRQVIGLGVVALVIIALAVGGYFIFLRKPYDVLFTKLRTMDAATIVAELDKRKLPYRLGDGGTTILMPRNLVDSTRLSVMSEDLPLKGTVGFELFNKSDMGLTEFAQRINYQRALQGELGRTIMTLDSVDAARVHLSLGEPSIFREDRRPPKASVTLVARPGARIPPETVRGVQRLVAAAVPELTVADVVVLDERGSVVSPDGPVIDAAPPAADERTAIETYYAARIRKEVVGLLLPSEGTQVTVTATMPPGGQGDAGLESWTPRNRAFGLSVSVASPSVSSPQLEAEVRRATEAAIDANPSLGDQVMISTAATVTGPVAAAPISAVATPPPAGAVAALPKTGGGPSQFWLNLLLPVLALLLIGALLLHWRGRPARKMTADQRADYVRRLRELMDGEEGHVAPPV